MIENKEIPGEYVSIRQVWLQNITRCSEAISNKAKPDISDQGEWQEIGNRTVVHTIGALFHSLVDYGEATVRTDTRKYYKEKIVPEINHIWKLWEGNITRDYVKEKYPEIENSWEIDSKVKELKEKKPSAQRCWREHADISIQLYDFIIQVLNKYGMLFETQPKGYSNVAMEVIK